MYYLKRNAKFSILPFLVLILFITISVSPLAKTVVYFSLSDNPQKAIIQNINRAEAFINIAMYTFTDKDILLSLENAQERGVKVRVYLDRSQIESTYSISRLLVQKGIKTRVSTNNYIMHNKFAIIDNSLLLTGSYNWTASANTRNDENLMVIDDLEIIAIFQNQFVNLWTNKYSSARTKELFDKAKVNILTVFPSVQTGTKVININTASQEKLTSILQISQSLSRKIITLRDSLSGGFKDPQDFLQLPELTNLEWQEWKEQGIIIAVK